MINIFKKVAFLNLDKTHQLNTKITLCFNYNILKNIQSYRGVNEYYRFTFLVALQRYPYALACAPWRRRRGGSIQHLFVS